MRLDELVVEVRNKSLVRLGIIQPRDLDLAFTGENNNVGSWTLKLDYNHPLTAALRTPGSGLIVTQRGAAAPHDVVFSGPTIAPEMTSSPDDPGGTVTFEGVTDTIILADHLALPSPSTGYTDSSTTGYDVVTDDAESAMHSFVYRNIGSGARAVAGLEMGVNGARGSVKKWSARYDKLGELLATIAATADLTFRVVQRGTELVFETNQAVDRSQFIRLDARTRTLAGQRIKTEAPKVTRVIVAGQGEGEARQIGVYTSTPSAAAEADWGRRIEQFVDQRQTADTDEHATAASDALADGGYTGVTVQAVPFEDSSMRYGPDWAMGDLVTAVLDGVELFVYVTGVVLKADSDGLRLGVVLGSDYRSRNGDPLEVKVGELEARLSHTERVIESPVQPEAHLPFRMAAGVATFNLSSQSTVTQTITFPADRFTQPPIVTLTIGSGTNSYLLRPARLNATPTVVSMSVEVGSLSGSNVTATSAVQWTAVQMTPSSSNG